VGLRTIIIGLQRSSCSIIVVVAAKTPPPILSYCAKWIQASELRPNATCAQRRGIETGEFVFREVSHEKTGPIRRTLRKPRAAQKSCWCMVWRSNGLRKQQRDWPPKAAGLRWQSTVESRRADRISASRPAAPHAWCSMRSGHLSRHLGGLDDSEQHLEPSLGRGLVGVLLRYARSIAGQRISKKVIWQPLIICRAQWRRP